MQDLSSNIQGLFSSITSSIEKAGLGAHGLGTINANMPKGNTTTYYWQGEGARPPIEIKPGTQVPAGYAPTKRVRPEEVKKEKKPKVEKTPNLEVPNPEQSEQQSGDVQNMANSFQNKLKGDPAKLLQTTSDLLAVVEQGRMGTDEEVNRMLDTLINSLDEKMKAPGLSREDRVRYGASLDSITNFKRQYKLAKQSGAMRFLHTDPNKINPKDIVNESAALAYLSEMTYRDDLYVQNGNTGYAINKDNYYAIERKSKKWMEQDEQIKKVRQEKEDTIRLKGLLISRKANAMTLQNKNYVYQPAETQPTTQEIRQDEDTFFAIRFNERLKSAGNDEVKRRKIIAEIRNEYQDIMNTFIGPNGLLRKDENGDELLTPTEDLEKKMGSSKKRRGRSGKGNIIEVDPLRATIVVSSENRSTLKRVESFLATQYPVGKLKDYIDIDYGGAMTGNATIKIKKFRFPGSEEPQDVITQPKYLLADAIQVSKGVYEKQGEGGKRISWHQNIGKGAILKTDAKSVGDSAVTTIQGGPRTGKEGLTNQGYVNDLATADSSIVKHCVWDLTNKHFSESQEAEKELIRRGMLDVSLSGYDDAYGNAVTDQEKSDILTKHVYGLSNAYDAILAEQKILMGNKATIEDVEGQTPTRVMTIGEMEYLESEIITNNQFDPIQRGHLLNMLARVITHSSSNGQKHGIHLRIMMQTGFKSDQLRMAMQASPKTNLISLDGQMDQKSIKYSAGMVNAWKKAKPGNAILFPNGKIGEFKEVSTVLPGAGSTKYALQVSRTKK